MGSLAEEIETEAEKQGRLKVLIELVRDGLISTEIAAERACI